VDAERNDMKLRIDPERCQGHGRCWDVAPELIDCDDEGRGVVTTEDVDGPQIALAQVAVRTCPERAVTLTDSSMTASR
jgi:ferredoxin